MSAVHEVDLKIETSVVGFHPLIEDKEADEYIGKLARTQLMGMLLLDETPGSAISLEIVTYKGDLTIKGTASTDQLAQRVRDAAAELPRKIEKVKSVDATGVKGPGPNKIEPAPPRKPPTDAEVCEALDAFLWHNIGVSTKDGETFDVTCKCVKGVVTLSGKTNSVMLRRKLEEVLPRAKRDVYGIVSIDTGGVPWP